MRYDPLFRTKVTGHYNVQPQLGTNHPQFILSGLRQDMSYPRSEIRVCELSLTPLISTPSPIYSTGTVRILTTHRVEQEGTVRKSVLDEGSL